MRALCLGLVGVLLVAGCTTTTQTGPAASANPPTGAVGVSGQDVSAALAQLAALSIKPAASMKGYSREQFGKGWTDVDHNGCDTRDDILRRDLTNITAKPGTDGCQIATGILHDPYTGHTIHFVRGVQTSAQVQIDHVVALGDAWRTGAQVLTAAQRRQLANDPIELLAVDGPTNEAKGDQDAATWLPPNSRFACGYVTLQIGVKAKYKLWVTQAEHDALASVLRSCPQTSAGTPSPAPASVAPAADSTQGTSTQDSPTPGTATPGSGHLPIVHPGSYCTPEGATGVTSAGTLMRCTSENGDRPRWRTAP